MDLNPAVGKPRRASRSGLISSFLVGAVLGCGAALLYPRAYIAEATLLFPTLSSTALKRSAQLLKLDASGVDWAHTPGTVDSQLVEAASVVLKSRAAINSTLAASKVALRPSIPLLLGDPVEAFRARDVVVDPQGGGSLVLRVRFGKPESARALCQGLLDYYTTFVHEHRLTNTARTRQQLEQKLVRVDKRLTILERKLLVSSSTRGSYGEMVKDPKVMRDLWKQRILEGGATGRLLDEMREVRKQAARTGSEESESVGVGEDWRARWGSASLEDQTKNDPTSSRGVRRPDIPSRLELERVYEETLLLYHAGILQYDFISMWESLENFDFEIVDPVTVHPESPANKVWLAGLLGGLAFTCLSAMLRSPNR